MAGSLRLCVALGASRRAAGLLADGWLPAGCGMWGVLAICASLLWGAYATV
jgi:hypothetical protein